MLTFAQTITHDGWDANELVSLKPESKRRKILKLCLIFYLMLKMRKKKLNFNVSISFTTCLSALFLYVGAEKHEVSSESRTCFLVSIQKLNNSIQTSSESKENNKTFQHINWRNLFSTKIRFGFFLNQSE